MSKQRDAFGPAIWLGALGLTTLFLSACGGDGGAQEVESDPAALEVANPGNPDFVCPYRLQPAIGEVRGFPYCATEDLLEYGPTPTDWNRIQRLVIAQHGRGGDAAVYVNTMNKVINWAANQHQIDAAETFVMAPQFIQNSDVLEQGLGVAQLFGLVWWKNGGSTDPLWNWSAGGLSTGNDPTTPYSSYVMIERMLDLAIARMPNLREIVFTGQSAGGQTIQRFAALNAYNFPEDVRVRYLPANPYGYMYLTNQRPTYANAPFAYGFQTPPAAPAVFAWPDLEVCPQLSGESMEAEYNDYEKGMHNLPAHYVGPSYALQAFVIAARYLQRNVTYLVGEADVTHDEQCWHGVQAQGRHRLERARAYAAHVQSLGASHTLAVIPDVGHGNGIYDQTCTREILFGLSTTCTSITDYDGGAQWAGNVISMAYGNIDLDLAEELAIVREVNGVTQLEIHDDANHGYALLYVPTLNWPAGDVATDVAFGNFLGSSAIRELLVGRQSRTGGAFVVYRFTSETAEVLLEGGLGYAAQAVAAGNINGSLDEIGVTFDATAGKRWAVYAIQNVFNAVEIHSGTWTGTSRPVAIAFGDVDGDGDSELVVGRSATSGPRAYLYDMLGSTMPLAQWPFGYRLVDLAFGNFDGDSGQELVLARTGLGWRWEVLDDLSGGFASVHTGGADWPFSVQPTAVATGVPSISKSYQASIALGRTGPVAGKVELITVYRDKPLLTPGNFRRDGLGLIDAARITGLAFGDVDGLGGDELGFGQSGDPAASYRYRVLAGPER